MLDNNSNQSIVDIKIPASKFDDKNFIKGQLIAQLKWRVDELGEHKLLKKSLDARKRPLLFQLRYVCARNDAVITDHSISTKYLKAGDHKKVYIIGAGPAGYFAALKLLEYGHKPIVIERGKDVQERRRDLKAIQQKGDVNSNSNYCFGEGGAGTYSDGKLYTRSHKRGKIEHILQVLVEHGASRDILIDAHPHIGSNKLPKIVTAIRETIEAYGGEVRFNTSLSDLEITNNKIQGLHFSNGKYEAASNVILCTGHSARDIYKMLDRHQVKLESKDFALGVRIEHPQALIDEIQYGIKQRPDYLPASSYKLVCQVKDKGVFSFCMCPGGLIVPAATAPGEIVVNGMSLSKRDSPFANAGTVTAVDAMDFKPFNDQGVFAGLAFQQHVEQIMFNAGDGSQKAPGQLLPDFIEGRLSSSLKETSYIPGLFSAPIHELLPDPIYNRLKHGIIQFGKMMKGYYTNEAQVVATESRTSSPIRIPRDKYSLMHPDVEGLYPCGEGAGYAGGILSAAMDGQKVANLIGENKV